MLKLYDATLLLHGDILNQVPLHLVSAAEIQMLRAIHVGNNDAVREIKHVANVNRTQGQERARLARKYAPDPFSLDGEVPVSGIQRVNAILGTGELPSEVPPELMGDARAAQLLADREAKAEKIEYLHPLEEAARADGVVEMIDGSDPSTIPPIPVIADEGDQPDDPFAGDGAALLKPQVFDGQGNITTNPRKALRRTLASAE